MFGKRLAQRGHREKNFATACQRENGGDAFGMNVGMRTYCFVITALMLLVTSAAAQWPPPTIVPPVPTLNPSSSLILPQPPPLPVSPAPGGSPHESQLSSLQPYPRPCSVFSGHPCNPSFCSVFHHGPCFPYYLPPLGQDLRLTIVSTDEDDSLVETVEMGGSMRSVRFATCLRRFALAGCRPRNRRRDMVWNTPSASLLSAMAP